MSYVRSFDDFTPPARFDAVPFTEALIQESASETTGFSTIDTKALNPVDSNPATPQARDFTTDDAALAAGWYRIVWKDAAGSTFESDAVYFPPATSAPAAVTLDDLSLDRIIKGRAATITVTITVDGNATDPSPDAATIEILRNDGSVLVAAGSGVQNTGTGTFAYTLSSTQTADLDNLTARWSFRQQGYDQVIETFVEIAGGVLFTLAGARALEPLGDETKFTTADIAAARTIAEHILEDACNVAFVPRYRRKAIDNGRWSTSLRLPDWEVRRIRSIDNGGTALTEEQLATCKVYNGRSVYYPGGFAPGIGQVVVGYEHGHPYPPPGAGRMALKMARRYLLKTPVDERATSISNAEMGTTMALVTPGVRGAMTDIPEVNAFIQQFQRPEFGL